MQKGGKMQQRAEARQVRKVEEEPEEFQKPLNKCSRPLKSDKDRKPAVLVPVKVEKREEEGPSTPKAAAKSNELNKEIQFETTAPKPLGKMEYLDIVRDV